MLFSASYAPGVDQIVALTLRQQPPKAKPKTPVLKWTAWLKR
jgi:hypothetical protein